MISNPKVVITDYDYDDLEIEKGILHGVGAEVIPLQVKCEEELFEVAEDCFGMINHSDFLEAIKFYGEIGIGQIGFQVIAISLGRRASGEWKAQDSVRFMMMIYNSIQGIILCYLPFYFVSLLWIEFPDLIYYLIAFSTFLI